MVNALSNMDFPVGVVVTESSCQCRRHKRCGFDPWSEKIPYAIGQLNQSATSTKPVL